MGNPSSGSSSSHALMQVLPFVSKHFCELCRSDYLWESALENKVQKEPYIWKEGLIKLCNIKDEAKDEDDTMSTRDLLKLANERLNTPGYLALYKMVKSSFLRLNSPVFVVPAEADVSIGVPNLSPEEFSQASHLESTRMYRLSLPRDAHLIQFLTERQHVSVVLYQQNIAYPQQHPYQIFITILGMGPHKPACLMKLLNAIVYDSGQLVTLYVEPVTYVSVERIKQESNTSLLPAYSATCLFLPDLHVAEQLDQTVESEQQQGGDAAPCCIL